MLGVFNNKRLGLITQKVFIFPYGKNIYFQKNYGAPKGTWIKNVIKFSFAFTCAPETKYKYIFLHLFLRNIGRKL